jgi:hypothetical protein
MNDLNTRAVITGSLVDVAGTLFASYVFFFAVAASTGTSGAADTAAAIDASAVLLVVQLAIGLSLTAAGAYVAAVMARGAERANAFAVGVLSTVISFLLVLSAPDTSPFWALAAGLILTIPAAFAGGELRRWIVARGGAQA